MVNLRTNRQEDANLGVYNILVVAVVGQTPIGT
jgi:hypothetical protein